MKKLRRLGWLFILLGVAILSGTSLAEEKFPSRPVEIIISWSAGGANDLLARAVAEVFPKYSGGQPLVVKNVPGAGAAIGFSEAYKAKPDGYTVLFVSNTMITLYHMNKVDFTVFDMAPVALLSDVPCYIVVSADSPYKDLRDYIADAKKRPGQVSLGNSGTGGGNHLIALAFQRYAKINLKNVPFDGSAPSFAALNNKLIDSAIGTPPEGVTDVQAGKIRILGILGPSRVSKFPEILTAKEQGLKFNGTMWRGIQAPKGTPSAAVKQLERILDQCLKDPAFRKVAEDNMWPLRYMGAKDFGRFLREEDARLKEVIVENKLSDRYK